MFTKQEELEAEERLKDVEIIFYAWNMTDDEHIEYKMEDSSALFEVDRYSLIPEVITADYIAWIIKSEYLYAYRWLEEWLLVDDFYTDIVDCDWDVKVLVYDERPNPAYSGDSTLFEEDYYRPAATLGGHTEARIF